MVARLAAAGALLTAPAAAAAQADLTVQAGWLAGCWEARTGNSVTLEMWMPPAGGLMVGASRSTADGVARAFEHLRLGMTDGRLVYTAIPSGQRETAFPATIVSDTMLAFENPAHDFPQRIIYRRAGGDSVAVRVEGRPGPNDTVRGFDLPLRRVACTQGIPSRPDPGPP